uniref:Uncharacterized protein n=1 Tax=Rhizobium rhizogenes TaxID=359 RepID=A0A7S4ZT78_RHIRH|nr:hypothetical protein pC5.8a_123 [Rhizobium rhizogenes]
MLVRARYISRRVPVWRKQCDMHDFFFHQSVFKGEIFMRRRTQS